MMKNSFFIRRCLLERLETLYTKTSQGGVLLATSPGRRTFYDIKRGIFFYSYCTTLSRGRFQKFSGNLGVVPCLGNAKISGWYHIIVLCHFCVSFMHINSPPPHNDHNYRSTSTIIPHSSQTSSDGNEL